jgi:hypothetical protein
MVIYFGGTGEHGKDLIRQFNQRGVFEKVCTPAFQEKHPCYLFAPMFPSDDRRRNTYQFSYTGKSRYLMASLDNTIMEGPSDMMAFLTYTLFAMIG